MAATERSSLLAALLYPWLAGPAAALGHYASGYAQLEGVPPWTAMLVASAPLVLALVLLRPLAGGWRRAAPAALGIHFSIFFYPQVEAALSRLLAFPLPLDWLTLPWCLGSLLAAIGSSLLLRRAPELCRRLTVALNAAVLMMLVVPLWVLAPQVLARAKAEAIAVDDLEGTESLRLPVPARDVYYLIFDRYAGHRTLREDFAFDNQPFLAALEQRGFYVATQGRANYPKTAHSLASSLNLQYLQDLVPQASQTPSDWAPLYNLLSHHRLQSLLRGLGYRYIHLGSWWEATRRNPHATESFNAGSPDELTAVMLQGSAIGALGRRYPQPGLSWLDPWFQREASCERVLAKLQRLDELAEEAGPKLVFAHFLLPHPPFQLDAEGRCLDREQIRQRGHRQGYLDQLRFANRSMLELVDRLLASPGPVPIIVLQSDEGPAPERLRHGPFDWRQATERELQHKLEILHAFLLPTETLDTEQLHPAMTPVNTFRLILDAEFGTRLGLLADRSYAYPNDQHLYDFFEVTDRLGPQAR